MVWCYEIWFFLNISYQVIRVLEVIVCPTRLRNNVFKENIILLQSCTKSKLFFNSYKAYLWSTLEKYVLKYLNILFVDHFIPISRKKSSIWSKKQFKRTIFLSYIQISQKFDTWKTGPKILMYQIFTQFEQPPKKWSFLKNSIFYISRFWSEKISNLRLPEYILFFL